MYSLGVDIGSTASKGIILDESGKVVSGAIIFSGTGTSGPARMLEQLFSEAGLTRDDMDAVVVTGYGRNSFEGADRQISELSCHSRGVHHLLPNARTIIDIGGQDVKTLKLDKEGRLANFVMNDKCAAGTGRFLDVMAKVLEVNINELAELSENATEKVSISSTCTVFAESEVISQLSKGVRKENIIAGIHDSIASRVAGLAKRAGIEDDLVMVGGVADNYGIVKAIEEHLGHPIIVPKNAQLTGALGAALYAMDIAKKR